MKEKFIKKIKYSKILFKLLNFFGNLFFGVIKYLVPINNKRVLLVSYGGRRFDDSPKAILDNLINDSRFKNYEFVIAIKEYDSIEKNTLIYNNLKNIRIVKIDTFIYFYMVMSSRIWITNSAIERSFTFIKKKKNIYVNTWHGTPIKKMGTDIIKSNESFNPVKKFNCDIFLSQGKYETEIFSRVYRIDKSKIHQIGLPRNDELINNASKDSIDIKEYFKIKPTKKVILYAPTFREFNIKFGAKTNNHLNWITQLDDGYVVLMRAHYETMDIFENNKNTNIIDVSTYDYINDLIKVSDLLITDYSSIMFDYSITEKPIILYCYDYDTYERKRGLYFDPRKELVYADSSSSLLFHIENNWQDAKIKTINFRYNYITETGQATQKLVDLLYSTINK